MFEVGSIVAGKYRVDRELGRGGMGMVVAATHVHLGTVVALKFLNEKMMAEPTVTQRFLREARASAQLHNEHICRVLDFGTESEVPYIVMELLEGHDLAKLVKQHPLSVQLAADYVIQACTGLAEAHAAGVIHRDLKPSNLFLTTRPDGSSLVKVFDFGVAKVTEAVDVNLTQTASVVGSPGYMSPEQVRASKKVDARSDIWALGVILYKLVSTRMPFKAESITDLAVAIAMDPTPPLHDVPLVFERIVMKCLEKDPARRYQDVYELIAALAPFVGSDARDTTQFPGMATNMPGPTAAIPTVVVADSPTTLRGASGVIERIPPKHNLRPWLIGAGLSIVIGVVVGMTWTSGSTAPSSQSATQPMTPVVEPQPQPQLLPVAPQPPEPAAIATPPITPPPVVKPVAKSVEHNKRTATVQPHVAPKADTPAVITPPAPAKPKDIGASRI